MIPEPSGLVWGWIWGPSRGSLGVKLVMLGGILACFSSLGHGFGRHLVEMKPTDALHLPI